MSLRSFFTEHANLSFSSAPTLRVSCILQVPVTAPAHARSLYAVFPGSTTAVLAVGTNITMECDESENEYRGYIRGVDSISPERVYCHITSFDGDREALLAVPRNNFRVHFIWRVYAFWAPMNGIDTIYSSLLLSRVNRLDYNGRYTRALPPPPAPSHTSLRQCTWGLPRASKFCFFLLIL